MNDEYPTDAAWHELQLQEQEWLADEAAQVEYLSWLASIHRTHENESQQSD